MSNPDNILFLASLLRDRAYSYLTSELGKKGISGIEPSHGVILRSLFEKGPLPMTELARLTSRTKPTVTVLVNKLEKRGYVKRSRDPEDGRVFLVSLTEKASGLAEDLGAVSRGMRETLFSGFDEDEKQTLAGLIEKAVKNFSDG